MNLKSIKSGGKKEHYEKFRGGFRDFFLHGRVLLTGGNDAEMTYDDERHLSHPELGPTMYLILHYFDTGIPPYCYWTTLCTEKI